MRAGSTLRARMLDWCAAVIFPCPVFGQKEQELPAPQWTAIILSSDRTVTTNIEEDDIDDTDDDDNDEEQQHHQQKQ